MSPQKISTVVVLFFYTDNSGFLFIVYLFGQVFFIIYLFFPPLEVTICAKYITSAIIVTIWLRASKNSSYVPPVHRTFAHREHMPNQISTNSESKVGTGTKWICHCCSPSFVLVIGGVSFVYLFILAVSCLHSVSKLKEETAEGSRFLMWLAIDSHNYRAKSIVLNESYLLP